MDDLKGIEFLRYKLSQKQRRIKKRYAFYEMKNNVRDLGISTPPSLRSMFNSLGWCAKAVDSLADRLQFREFENDLYGISDIYNFNNPDVIYDSAILGALISACSFIYISKGDDDIPRLQVIDGYNATGIIDPITNMMTEGYAVLSRTTTDKVYEEAYFIPGMTFFYREGILEYVEENAAPYCLLVPIIYKPDAIRPFGHSRISRACMSLVESALRTIKRSEISAEFFSFPQKYITGLSEDADVDKWHAAMSAFMTFTKDEDGDHPILGQFAQQSMEPHLAQVRMLASLFAGETGLTLDDLGFATENPSSAEAIKAAHENLRLTARKAQRNFGTGFINAGYLALCVKDNMPYDRRPFTETKAKWEPIFEPDSAMLSSIGDGAIKINQAVPGYIDESNLRDLTGIEK